jgi:hypothetical protein
MKAMLTNGLIQPCEPIPEDWPDGTELRVEKAPSPAPRASESIVAPGWPASFSESTFGSIDDDTFIRHPQGEFDRRAELE